METSIPGNSNKLNQEEDKESRGWETHNYWCKMQNLYKQ